MAKAVKKAEKDDTATVEKKRAGASQTKEARQKGSAIQKKEATSSNGRAPSAKKIAAVVFAAIIIFAIAGALVYGVNRAAPSSFPTFQNNFNSAPRVGILVTAYNATALTATVGCSSSLIEELVGSPKTHRNASTIDFYVMNQTVCVFSTGGIGSTIKNYTYTTTSNCIAASKAEPSIFINYSTTNSTTVYPYALYLSGDASFLSQCGIASEIT